jgi:hypothetical protein
MHPIAVRLRASRKRIVAETEADLHAAIAAADKEADDTGIMALVDFEAANGNTLSVVVGGAETALSFRYADDVTPRFLSRGHDSHGPPLPCSRDFTHQIECPRSAVISRGEGMAALEEFAASNELPLSVAWDPLKR